MPISEPRARELLYAAHEAFNRRDIDALMNVYVDDVVYWSNFGGVDGAPLIIEGRDNLKAFIEGWAGLESLSVPENFRLIDGVGHVTAEFFIKHLATGLAHSSTFRQQVSYRDDRISRLEEFHDAKAFAAFVAMMQRGTGA